MTIHYQIPADIPQSVFRTYDIRGEVDPFLTPDLLYAIGLAIGAEAHDCQQKTLAIGRDGRMSSPTLFPALAQGLLESGCDLIDIGIVPTPLLYFATHWLKTGSGVMLTASHNPADYNGVKVVLNHTTLFEAKIQTLYQRIINRQLVYAKTPGQLTTTDLAEAYINRITSDVHLTKPLKIVVDAGNGVAGHLAPALFRRMGCEVIELYCDIDGRFPNHHPDPGEVKNLKDLQAAVAQHQAALGLAFDGDADRLGVVTNRGEIIWPDRQMMLFARDVLSRNPHAEIIFDVKCSRYLPQVIAQNHGIPLMWKTGHSILKGKMQERNAPLAGEMSGHIFFKERWYGFDDGIYAAARLLEILSRETGTASAVFQTFPNSVNTPELKLPVPEAKKLAFMETFLRQAQFDGKITTLDGMRVDFPDGWGLLRVSNTSPCLTLRFEADDASALQRIQALFRAQLLAVDPTVQLPF
ncbi:MAG: phosphomannomutase/phosphoglucomutase [Gammaproteobacteria bacterium]